uniref:Somatostatin/Cortistatin C-terminal domain-containing protein n=1 Tax=Hippocampus comes TaxID=109280 RepID=A0A3Q2YX05_HIPCM
HDPAKMLRPLVLLALVLSGGLLVRLGAAAPDAGLLLAEALGADAAPAKVGCSVLHLIAAPPQLGVGPALTRRHLPLGQRERKAGCRNFFWKTFTSC